MPKELLFSVTQKDFRIDYFRAGGPGGQHQNKTSSACRFTHVESGAVGESREEREQARNKIMAFRRCVSSPKFQSWLRIKTAEVASQETVEEKVEKLLQPHFLKVEVKDEEGRWVREH